MQEAPYGQKPWGGVKGRRRIEVSRNEPEAYCELIPAPGMEAGYDAVGVTSLLQHSTAQQSKEDHRGRLT